MSLDLIIDGAEVFLDGRLRAATVGVRDGRIERVFPPGTPADAVERVDARGMWVLPGLIDPHVHLRDPGAEYKEDIRSGTAAAAAGGITTVADMPNCSPPTVGTDAIAAKAAKASSDSYVDFAIWAGATRPEDVTQAAAAGAIGIKLYLNGPVNRSRDDEWDPRSSTSHPGLTVRQPAQLYEIVKAAAEVDLPVAVHLGEQTLIDLHRGGWAGRSFAEVVEEYRVESTLDKRIAAATCVEIAGETGAWVHLVHVWADVVPIAVAGMGSGARITLESLVPFMSFSLADTLGPQGFNRYKTDAELDRLWSYIRDRTIGVIATDHAPQHLAEKDQGWQDMLACPSGFPELETSAAMMLNEVTADRLDLAILVETMSTNPAALLGLQERKGTIAPGYDADLAIVDPSMSWSIGDRPFLTKSNWSPYQGRSVTGRVEGTVVRGRIVYWRGSLVGSPGHGDVLRRHRQ